jgi:predicted ferric reductase
MRTETTATRPSRSRPPAAPVATSPLAYVPQGTREGAVAAVIAAVGAVVVGMWWRDTPVGSLHGLGDLLIAAGRITGLLGAYLILVEVLLMGRVAWLDRLIGMDRLATWHRRNGQYSITLLAGHALLTLWGYALTDHHGLASETRTVLAYPDVLAATAGLALFVLVGAVSARAVRRRVGYQTWYLLHLSTYLALALSFGHQLSTGGDFLHHPLNQALWIGLYVLVAGLVLGYRIGLPVRNALRHRLRVTAVVKEGPGVVSVYVKGNRLEELRAEAGQFFLWRFLTPQGWWQAHPFSLSAAPNPSWLRLTVKTLGDHTAQLQRLRPGTRVLAEGPYGAFTRLRRTRRKVLLIGAGIGIAPLRALFEGLPAGPGELTLLYRASRPEELVFRAELDELAQQRGAAVHYLVGPRSQRPDPLGAPALTAGIPGLVDHDVYVCGPSGLVAGVVRSLEVAGVPRRRIHVEGFEL